jgi:ABC-type sugar transport system permease subunit
LHGYVYIAPLLILFAVFAAFPDIYTLVLSFQHSNGFSPATSAGWSNYTALLHYGAFWSEAFNTVEYWVLHAVILIPLAFVIALIVRSKFIRGRSAWRGLIFLPQVMSFVAVALVFQVVFASPGGVVNGIFGTDISWLTNFSIAKWVIVALLVWQGLGFWFVVFLAGLTGLDPAIEDAARIDGANIFQKTMRITVPLMKNIIFFAVVIDAISSMALYTQPNVLATTNGSVAPPAIGPLSNQVVTNLQAGVFGQSAAAGILLFVLTVLVSAVVFGGFMLMGGRISIQGGGRRRS